MLLRRRKLFFQYVKICYKVCIGLMFVYLYIHDLFKMITGFIIFYVFAEIVDDFFRKEFEFQFISQTEEE